MNIYILFGGMYCTNQKVSLIAAMITSAVLLVALSGLVTPVLASEQQVTICHRPPGDPQNVQTIAVGQSAVSAHLGHGDTLGACPPPPPQPATLTVTKQVINDDGGTAQASDFTLRLHIINCDGTLRGAIEFQGSEQGTTFQLNPEVDCGYRVLELVPAEYTLTTDCRRELGDGITPGATYTCIHINNDNPT
jgi:Prealbumin-like fold domain